MTEHVKTNYEVEINLGVWVISIVVSIRNGIINLFKMDELYYNLGITLEKLKQFGINMIIIRTIY